MCTYFRLEVCRTECQGKLMWGSRTMKCVKLEADDRNTLIAKYNLVLDALGKRAIATDNGCHWTIQCLDTWLWCKCLLMTWIVWLSHTWIPWLLYATYFFLLNRNIYIKKTDTDYFTLTVNIFYLLASILHH